MTRFHHSQSSSCPKPGSAARAAADVARALDPAYARPRSPQCAQYVDYQPRAFVDADGALHDPDYRVFALPPSPGTPSTQRGLSPTRSPGRAYSPLPPVTPPADDFWATHYAPAVTSGPRRGSASTTYSSNGSLSPGWDTGSSGWSRRPSYDLPRPVEYAVEEEDDDDAPIPTDDAKDAASSQHHSLRYQLESASLSIKLGVFRAKRRWRERKDGQT